MSYQNHSILKIDFYYILYLKIHLQAMHLDVRLDTIIVINREAKPFPYPDFTLANLENNICEFSLCKTVLK